MKIAIHGAAGYTGRELLRILAGHPEVSVVQVTSGSFEAQAVGEVFPGLAPFYDLRFVGRDAEPPDEVEVVFLGLPHGEAMAAVPPLLAAGKRIIDLSADFRLQDPTAYPTWYKRAHTAPEFLPTFAYGLTEWCKDEVREARAVANPGCYPTGALLAVLPALASDLVDPTPLIIDAKSGVSGAGRKSEVQMLFSETADSMKAYGVAGHRHWPEIRQGLAEACRKPVGLTFVPHLTPMIRGIHATLYARLAGLEADLQALYEKRYVNEPFVDVMPHGSHPETRSVRASNVCRIAVHRPRGGDTVVILSVIDNLVKGAAGQAVQNMNIMFGLDERTGLRQAGVLP